MKDTVSLLPDAPGIYVFKDGNNKIVYIGKAKSIKKRVKSYFQRNHSDWKVKALLEDHVSIDFILTNNEVEALLLEAQLIRDYKPKYNILLKNGQPFLYIVFTLGSLPEIKLVRNKKLKGEYFGPFLHKTQARKTFEYLVAVFRLNLCNKKIENGCLDYHIGLCAGNCKSNFDEGGYIFRLKLAKGVLKSSYKKILKNIKDKIEENNKNFDFEKSKYLQEYVDNLDVIFHTIKTKFSEEKFSNDIFNVLSCGKQIKIYSDDIDKKLGQILNISENIRSIDCFDISHFQSRYIVGASVRFVNGIPDKNSFRRFKIRSLKKQNDYAALQEIVARRYKDKKDLPDLVMIDGGKGQLNAILPLVKGIECISLAKREEIVFSKNLPQGVKLDIGTEIGRFLIAIRDYAHHFAISYHRKQRSKNLVE